MSSVQQQPIFVIYDRQYGNYIRLYGLIPDQSPNRVPEMSMPDRYTLFDLRQSEWSPMSYSGDFAMRQQPLLLGALPLRHPEQRHQEQRRQQPIQGNHIPKFVTDLILRGAATEGKLCPITMEPIEATEAYTVTPCYHAFNKEALQRWTRDHHTCPECNGRI